MFGNQYNNNNYNNSPGKSSGIASADVIAVRLPLSLRFQQRSRQRSRSGLAGKLFLLFTCVVMYGCGEVDNASVALDETPTTLLFNPATDVNNTATSSAFANGQEVVRPRGQFFIRFPAQSEAFGQAPVNPARVTDIERQLAPSMNAVNSLINFPEGDVPISVSQCGLVNAFYLADRNEIVLCTELLDAAFGVLLDLYDQDSQPAATAAGQAFTFFMLHEMAHALDDLLNLPIFGNTESAADAIATVLGVETGTPQSVLFAAYLFTLSGDGSFGDVHHAGQDRAGDLMCWLLGSDPGLLEIQGLNDLGQRFVDAGRDCTGEYQDQRAAVELWIPGISGLRSRASSTLTTTINDAVDPVPATASKQQLPASRVQLDKVANKLSKLLL